MKYHLKFAEQLLLCLMYYRTHTNPVFMGLVFNVSSPTVCRRIQAMTDLMAGHFRMPGRKIKLSDAKKSDLLYLMIDGTERPVQASQDALGSHSKILWQEKQAHGHLTRSFQEDKKRILAVGPARHGRKHDTRIYEGARRDRPPDIRALVDLGYLGTSLETPFKTSQKKSLTKADLKHTEWHAKGRIGVEHGIGRLKEFKIFADIHRNNRQQNMRAKTVGSRANLNLKTA